MAEILSLGTFVAQAFLMTVQHDIVFTDTAGDILLTGEIDGLRDVAGNDQRGIIQLTGEFEGGLFAHAVSDHVGPRVTEDAGA